MGNPGPCPDMPSAKISKVVDSYHFAVTALRFEMPGHIGVQGSDIVVAVGAAQLPLL